MMKISIKFRNNPLALTETSDTLFYDVGSEQGTFFPSSDIFLLRLPKLKMLFNRGMKYKESLIYDTLISFVSVYVATQLLTKFRYPSLNHVGYRGLPVHIFLLTLFQERDPTRSV